MAYSATECKGDGMGDYGRPCNGYARTESPCAVCLLAHKLYSTEENSAGFVEVEETDNFPITVIAYRGINTVTVKGIRCDSISTQVDKRGNAHLSFEFYENANRIGYIPCVDWYETVCE